MTIHDLHFCCILFRGTLRRSGYSQGLPEVHISFSSTELFLGRAVFVPRLIKELGNDMSTWLSDYVGGKCVAFRTVSLLSEKAC